MSSLIKVTEKEGKKIVSAKELYLGLGLNKKNWTRWYPINLTNSDYFKENIDWAGVPLKEEGNETMDFAISTEFAKHIAMMARTEKSHEYRNYFLECEKTLQSNFKIPSNFKEALLFLVQAEEEKEVLNAQLLLQQPKVIFADAVSASSTSILVGDLAKLLKQNKVDTGAVRLFERLREEGYLIKRKGTDYNMPTQKSMELGLFEVKETSIAHSDGHISISKTSKVTGKGQVYFINRFKANN